MLSVDEWYFLHNPMELQNKYTTECEILETAQ